MTGRSEERIGFRYNRNASNNIEINPTQAMAVKLSFELYADRESMQGNIYKTRNV